MGVMIWLLIIGACVGGGWFVRCRRRRGRRRTAPEVWNDTDPAFKKQYGSRSLRDGDMRTTGTTVYGGSAATDADADADAGGTDAGAGGFDTGGFDGGGGGFDAGGFGGGGFGGGADAGGGGV